MEYLLFFIFTFYIYHTLTLHFEIKMFSLSNHYVGQIKEDKIELKDKCDYMTCEFELGFHYNSN